ncbi:hypothetical protein A5893_04515 [Pedobacter psychrophilus]|uniref:Uncharacterized protein n=2 Tax=Pedobacter psychrophilus TaxID=1826909 RepID=A0A179DNE2_9SPHI|nr:hypothetical protein A5893_04515 [Pedobacter psychrophilus]
MTICCSQKKSIEIIYYSKSQDKPTNIDEEKVYVLKKKALNADFDTTRLFKIDSIKKTCSTIKNIFEPINGVYNYYQFISTHLGRKLVFPGENLKDSLMIGHDILIIKTDNENKIIDAFQYTLEWGEYPLQSDLYRSTINGLKIKNHLKIEQFKFVSTENNLFEDNFEDGRVIWLK